MTADIFLDSYGYDLDGDKVTAFITSLPQHGSLSVDRSDRVASGHDSVSLTASTALPAELKGLYNRVTYASEPSDPYNVSKADR